MNNPLPLRSLSLQEEDGYPFHHAPPYLFRRPSNQPFDFCGHVRRLLEDMVARCEKFSHIDVSRILFAITQARNGQKHGLQARVTPLRFQHGQLTRQRRGITYQVQRLFLEDHEFLYLMTFCLPRFLNQNFKEKLITLIHELFHISPEFNGDLRRHGGRYDLHTHSQREYDQRMERFVDEYLKKNPDRNLYDFLNLDFMGLCQKHGAVRGIVVPRPLVIPLDPSATSF